MFGLIIGLDSQIPFLEVGFAEKAQAISGWIRIIQKGSCSVTIAVSWETKLVGTNQYE